MLDLGPYVFVADVQLGLHVGPLRIGNRACLPLDPLLLAGPPCLVTLGEDVLSPAAT